MHSSSVLLCQIEVAFLLSNSHCALPKGVTHSKHAAPGSFLPPRRDALALKRCVTPPTPQKNNINNNNTTFIVLQAGLKTDRFVLLVVIVQRCVLRCALSWIIRTKPSQCFRCFLSIQRTLLLFNPRLLKTMHICICFSINRQMTRETCV